MVWKVKRHVCSLGRLKTIYPYIEEESKRMDLNIDEVRGSAIDGMEDSIDEAKEGRELFHFFYFVTLFPHNPKRGG